MPRRVGCRVGPPKGGAPQAPSTPRSPNGRRGRAAVLIRGHSSARRKSKNCGGRGEIKSEILGRPAEGGMSSRRLSRRGGGSWGSGGGGFLGRRGLPEEGPSEGVLGKEVRTKLNGSSQPSCGSKGGGRGGGVQPNPLWFQRLQTTEKKNKKKTEKEV